MCKGFNRFQAFCHHFMLTELATSSERVNPRCKFTKFVILEFWEIFYSEKSILKVDIRMAGIIHLTFILPK